MRTLTVNEVQVVSGGVGPGGGVAGGVIGGAQYIFANAGTSNWNTGAFLVQVGAGFVGGFTGMTALRAVWGFNAAVGFGTLERIVVAKKGK